MENFKKVNLITGWLVFLIAAMTYLLTIEPTTSFWDCGEFITTGFKLEVGHPPGAPLFMMMARFFSLFAFGNNALVPVMVNSLSALASAFTILFLFWSVTHMAKRIVINNVDQLKTSHLIAIMGTGAVAALAYTFSDTFWFSAVEGEVYASSSLFTAVVFWAILKWENEADQKYANRWLILIAYLMGLSIGVHLLNLLVIPAIVFVYYFKKYEVTVGGIIKSALISVGILGFIMYGVIIGYVVVGSKFELLFTNGFGLPFKTGFITYLLLTFGALVFGVYYTFQKQNALWNTVFSSLLVILIGYSSFAVILIRSNADTPMNQNSPDNVFEFISYLNRDQYGENPLIYGQYFNAPVTKYEEGKALYKEEGDKYVVADRKVNRKFDSKYTTLFPRMYSDSESPNHIQGYAMWTGNSESDFYNVKVNPQTGQIVKDRYGDPIIDKSSPRRVPTFFENLRYFFAYQLNHMYLRYFFWNFVGRQNDIQGHGNVKNGNWISGITFLDEMRLGNQDAITDFDKNNKARNKYYFLPLILGIIGLIYMLGINTTGNRYFWVVLLFFFFTGIAIVLYLNQPPYQPRERDYAYAGSFYAFAIYIGFGVLAIYQFLKEKLDGKTSAITATALGLMIPALMAFQNWDDHDRSNRFTARDYAMNYLNSCAPNAIIFTNGDNDTFPLWYVQEVEGIRTDVRVINLSYFNTEWYINQMRKKIYESDPVKFSLDSAAYDKGVRDVVYVMRNPNLYLNEKYAYSKNKLEANYKALFDKFMGLMANSNFASKFPDEAQKFENKRHNSLTPTDFFRLLRKLSDKSFVKNKGLDYSQAEVEKLMNESEKFIEKISNYPLPLSLVMKHISSNDKNDKAPVSSGEFVNYLPTTKFLLPVDKDKIRKLKVVPEKDFNKIPDNMVFSLKGSYLRKNQMMSLDILANADWDRPVYFASTVGSSHYLNLEPYFQLEGLSYRVTPVKSNNGTYRVNTDVLFENVMNKFKWGGLENKDNDIYLDENNRRFLLNFKNIFTDLSDALIAENKKDSAKLVLDKCVNLFTNEMSPYGYYDLLIGKNYYRIGEDKKGDTVFNTTFDNLMQELDFYNSISSDRIVGSDYSRTLSIALQAVVILRELKKQTKAKELSDKILIRLDKLLDIKSRAIQLKTNEQAFYAWYTSLPGFKQHAVSVFMQLQELGRQ